MFSETYPHHLERMSKEKRIIFANGSVTIVDNDGIENRLKPTSWHLILAGSCFEPTKLQKRAIRYIGLTTKLFPRAISFWNGFTVSSWLQVLFAFSCQHRLNRTDKLLLERSKFSISWSRISASRRFTGILIQ